MIAGVVAALCTCHAIKWVKQIFCQCHHCCCCWPLCEVLARKISRLNFYFYFILTDRGKAKRQKTKQQQNICILCLFYCSITMLKNISPPPAGAAPPAPLSGISSLSSVLADFHFLSHLVAFLLLHLLVYILRAHVCVCVCLCVQIIYAPAQLCLGLFI